MRNALILFLVALGGLAGCGGSDFGAEMETRPRAFALEREEPFTFSLPETREFAIHFASSSEQIGLDGEADGAASSTPQGTGEATARVKNAGMAEGVFQVGHGFRNATTRQMDLNFEVQLAYSYELTADPPPGRKDARIGLKLYARDGRGRFVRKDDLISQSSERGAAQREANETYRFVVTLGPTEEIDIYLAGQALVEAQNQRSAAAALRITNLSIKLQTTPAPQVSATTRPAADEPR